MNGPVVTVWWGRTAGDVRQRARALVVRAASSALGRPAQTIALAYQPNGRPYLSGDAAGLHVGISHCAAGVVAVVVSPLAPVGVDVEMVRPLPVEQLALRWMLPTEAAWLAGQPEPDRISAFLHLWTFKEAVGKAYGIGLRNGGLRRPAPPGWPTTCLKAVPGDPEMVAAGFATQGVIIGVACASGMAGGRTVAVHQAAGC